MEPQEIPVPLTVGSHVMLYEKVDSDDEGRPITDVMYSETVEQHVPDTGLIRMSDGTGRAELLRLINEAKGIEIIR